jgi:hypothetical protein
MDEDKLTFESHDADRVGAEASRVVAKLRRDELDPDFAWFPEFDPCARPYCGLGGALLCVLTAASLSVAAVDVSPCVDVDTGARLDVEEVSPTFLKSSAVTASKSSLRLTARPLSSIPSEGGTASCVEGLSDSNTFCLVLSKRA